MQASKCDLLDPTVAPRIMTAMQQSEHAAAEDVHELEQ